MSRVRFTRDNTAVLLIDHQVGLFTGVRDINVNELKHNVVGLAQALRRSSACRSLPSPPRATACGARPSPSSNRPWARRYPGSVDRERLGLRAIRRRRVKATGRDHLIIAGLSFEVCASLPAISARDNGFQPGRRHRRVRHFLRSTSAKPDSHGSPRWASRSPTTPP